MSMMPPYPVEKYCFVACPPERCDCMAGGLRRGDELLGGLASFLASGIEARRDETRSGSVEDESPAPKGDVQ